MLANLCHESLRIGFRRTVSHVYFNLVVVLLHDFRKQINIHGNYKKHSQNQQHRQNGKNRSKAHSPVSENLEDALFDVIK